MKFNVRDENGKFIEPDPDELRRLRKAIWNPKIEKDEVTIHEIG
jgi:hypothetical protein